MSWFIVPQTEKRGKAEFDVDCKHVQFYPIYNSAGRQAGFGRLNFPVLQVIISNGHAEHRIVWSNYHGQSMDNDSPGKFTYRYADKFERPKIKTPKGEVFDPLSKPRWVKGGKQEYENHSQFYNWLAKHRGKELADTIFNLFANRMVEIESKRLAKAA